MGLFSWLTHKHDDIIDDKTLGFNVIEKFGENLTPNMRALRLAMRVADVMLSMGVSANSVVSRALDVTETYCERPVHIDITSNLIFLSQIRGVDKEPLTLIRPMTEREINYITLRNVQSLIHRIREGKVSLDDAEKHFDDIMKKPVEYPWWVPMLGSGVLVSGVTLFYTSSFVVVAIGFLIGMIVERIMYYLSSNAIPPFFRQVIVAMTVTIIAAVIKMMYLHGVDFLIVVNPSLIVVAGIVLLVAGLAIVASMQDAIEEYYLTSNARFTKVLLQTTGIVVGVMVGLYIARNLGIGIIVDREPVTVSGIGWQIIGAYLMAFGFSISRHTQIRAVLWMGLVGVSSFVIFNVATGLYDINVVPASAIAAFAVGLVGAMMSRFWHTPSIAIMSAGIVPLVPGLMLYRGLMQVMSDPPGQPGFFTGLGTLSMVLAIGLAIAVGAVLGNMVGRPMHQRLARARNFTPFMEFMRRQSEAGRGKRLGLFALQAKADDEPHRSSKDTDIKDGDTGKDITNVAD